MSSHLILWLPTSWHLIAYNVLKCRAEIAHLLTRMSAPWWQSRNSWNTNSNFSFALHDVFSAVNSVERLNNPVYSVPPVLLCLHSVLWNALVHPVSPLTTLSSWTFPSCSILRIFCSCCTDNLFLVKFIGSSWTLNSSVSCRNTDGPTQYYKDSTINYIIDACIYVIARICAFANIRCTDEPGRWSVILLQTCCYPQLPSAARNSWNTNSRQIHSY